MIRAAEFWWPTAYLTLLALQLLVIALEYGGGISSTANNLTAVDSTFSNNYGSSEGGGIFSANGTTNLARLTVEGNYSSNRGGGISSTSGNLSIADSHLNYNRSYGGDGGGGIFTDGTTTTIERTTLTNNRGSVGGGVSVRGGSLNVTESTFSNNGAYASGGALHSEIAQLTIRSSTISGNYSSIDGGGLSIHANLNQYVLISNSTIAFNRAQSNYYGAGTGGGIITSGPGTISLRHTLVAKNERSGAGNNDIWGRVYAQYSLIGVDTGLLLAGNFGNLIGTAQQPIDPLLDVLADNGGPTQTHALLPGSPAIDAGDPNAYYYSPAYDQRGEPFTRIRNGDGKNGAVIDIGAYELQPAEIHGQSWNDRNSNGVKDPGEQGLAGWTIFLDENNNGQFDVDMLTFSPTFVPVIVPPFQYGTSTIHVSGLTPVADVNVKVNISAPVVSNLYNLYLISPLGYSIPLVYNAGVVGSNFTNTIFDDEATLPIGSGSAPFTGSFQPLYPLSNFDGTDPNGDWQLQFYNNDGLLSMVINNWSLIFTTQEPTTTTDAAGNYAFVDLPAGAYGVGEIPQQNWTQTAPSTGVYSVQLSAGEIASGIDFGNHPDPAVLRGQKWNDLDNDGVHDAGESGLPGWTIYLDINHNGQLDLNQVQVEPDDFAAGASLSNPLPGVTLSVLESSQAEVEATDMLGLSSTGSLAFGSDVSAKWYEGHSLRVDFSAPTDFVSIDAVGTGSADHGTLSAYDSQGALLATYTTLPLTTGQVNTMSIPAIRPTSLMSSPAGPQAMKWGSTTSSSARTSRGG